MTETEGTLIIKNKKITLIGLGLIGGSLARAIHKQDASVEMIAIDPNMDSMLLAKKEGIIRDGFQELHACVYDSDIIFICTPVKHAVTYLDQLASKVKPSCIFTDVGSTKGEIIAYVDQMQTPPCFIGGHPMAGTEKTGYSAGFSHLFENVYYILTPSKTTTPFALDTLVALVTSIGGIPVILNAQEHDQITGSISHIPHVIASALVNLVKDMDSNDGKMQMLAAGGFRDITRIASSSPEMWENIVLSNREQISAILDLFISKLHTFQTAMKKEDQQHILSFFEMAKNFRDSFNPGRDRSNPVKGLIQPSYELIVDVEDKPGIIGEIATLLGKNYINIKNINVSNSREFELGCLKITLADEKSVNIAYGLLTDIGYRTYKTD